MIYSPYPLKYSKKCDKITKINAFKGELMRKLEKTLYSAAAYTVLFAIFFYVFALATDIDGKSIGVTKFFIILSFGTICAVADLIYSLLNLKKWVKAVIHYGILVSAFCIIFLFGDYFLVKGAASVFVAITLFTVLYAVFSFTLWLIGKTVSRADDALEAKVSKTAISYPKREKNKESYTQRFQ